MRVLLKLTVVLLILSAFAAPRESAWVKAENFRRVAEQWSAFQPGLSSALTRLEEGAVRPAAMHLLAAGPLAKLQAQSRPPAFQLTAGTFLAGLLWGLRFRLRRIMGLKR